MQATRAIRGRRLAGLAAALALVGGIGLAGCGTETGTMGDDLTSSWSFPGTETETPATDEAPATEETPVDDVERVTVDDLKVTLRVLESKSYGSAGGLVTVEPSLSFVSNEDAALEGGFEVTIQINGDEDGPIIRTIDVEEGGYYSSEDEMVSTPPGSNRVTAEVIDVYYPTAY